MLIILSLINIITLFICLPVSIKHWIKNEPRDALFGSALCVLSFSLLFLFLLPMYWGLIEFN